MWCSERCFRDTSCPKMAPFCDMTFRDTSRTFRDTSKGLFEIHQKDFSRYIKNIIWYFWVLCSMTIVHLWINYIIQRSKSILQHAEGMVYPEVFQWNGRVNPSLNHYLCIIPKILKSSDIRIVERFLHIFMTASDKRRKQWKDASRTRKQKIQSYKLSTPKKYQHARTCLNHSNRKVYSKKANSGAPSSKLARYHRLLNKFDRNRRLIQFKINATRDRSLKRAIDKAKCNTESSKALQIVFDLAEIQKENFLM